MSRRKLFLKIALVLFLAIWLFPAAVSMITDLWFFREIGYQVVFVRELVTRAMLFFVVGVPVTALIYFNLRRTVPLRWSTLRASSGN